MTMIAAPVEVPPLVTVKEFAALTRCDVGTVYRRIWSGRQPGAIRSGGQWRIEVRVALTPYAPLDKNA